MTLQHKNLLYYYPYPNIRRQAGIFISKNHFCFWFHKSKKLEIYDNKTFELIYKTNDGKIYDFFFMFPFMININVKQNIHVYHTKKEYVQSFSSPNDEKKWYLYTFKIDNQKVICTIDPQFINTSYRAEKEVDYEAFFNQLNPKFSYEALSKAQTIFNKQFNFRDNLDYGFDIKKDTKHFFPPRGGRYNNISLHWFEFPNSAKRPEEWIQGRIVAINLLTKKIIWYFDLELITRKKKNDLVRKKFHVKDDPVSSYYGGNYSPRTYRGIDCFSRNIYIFNHNFELYALHIETGKILWQRSNTSELPIPYQHKGYFVNLRGTYRIIDLETGEELVSNKNWIKNSMKDEVVWYKFKTLPNTHIKIYDEHIVVYDFRRGNLYFYKRETGNYLYTVNIQEQYWNCAVQLNLISQQEMEERRKKERWVCGTDYWEVHMDRLYIKFDDVFCVYDLTDFNESNEPQRIGESPRN